MSVFHGTEDKSGTTMIAQSVCKIISDKYKKLKVLYLGMSEKPAFGYLKEAPKTILDFVPDLEHELLSIEDFKIGLSVDNNLFSIEANKTNISSGFFKPEVVKILLDFVNPHFDILIVDAGNSLKDGFSVGALEYISHRIFIVPQTENAFKRLTRLLPIYKELGFNFDKLIINFYIKNDPHDIIHASQRFDLNKEDILIVSEALNSRHAEIDNKTLLEYRERKYKKDIEKLVSSVAYVHGLSERK